MRGGYNVMLLGPDCVIGRLNARILCRYVCTVNCKRSYISLLHISSTECTCNMDVYLHSIFCCCILNDFLFGTVF